MVGVKRGRMSVRAMEESLKEISLLITTAGGTVAGQTWQDIKKPHPAYFLGKGKVGEIAGMVKECNAAFVAVDEELSPVQNRNLERAWGVRVVDRTAVILDIFALRARTKEGKLQVELAQLEYLAPRLVGRGVMLSQQAGRIGTRGPGETQLEYDRRRLRERITMLKRRLDDVRRHRDIHRQKRSAVPLPMVSLVGYTNAGKSTLLNALTDARVRVEDQLFSTLDPTVRRLTLDSGRQILLADTVGFIRRLPHQLVESFKATFEELAYADLLVEVVDLSDRDYEDRMQVVADVLQELELVERPRLTVYNKVDLQSRASVPSDGLAVSALTGKGIARVAEAIDEALRRGFMRVHMKLGHDQGDIASVIHRIGHVIAVRHCGRTMHIDCELPPKYVGKYRRFVESD